MSDNKYKILIVEDEAIVAVDIENGLSSAGYEVCGIAASGKEAIAKAEQERPHIILMDIRLQGKMTGIEAAQEIRVRFGIPVVFLTAHSDDATIQSAKVAQPFGYILKPFGVRELRAATETALYKAEMDRKLTESERWNRAIITSAQNGFVAMDCAGIILDWNPFAETLFGISKSDAIAKSFIDLIIPERLKAVYTEGLQKLLATGASSIANRTIEQYGLHSDGNEVPIEITISSAEIDGSTKIFVFITDISQRKQFEIQKARAEELERTNKDLERFAHLASHDLQEPLRTISMYTQLLQESLQSKATEAEGDMLGHVINSSKRMSLLLDELLKFSRVGANITQMQKVNSLEAIKNAISNLADSIKHQNVKVSYDALPMVFGNLTHLEQVFQNLISNSIKFHGIDPIEISISVTRLGEFWRFLVQDNGSGFDMCYSTQIFEMFKRLNSDPNIPGAGVGLTICKKIIALHGGKIWAESEPGKGTKIFFTLPALERSLTTLGHTS